MSFVVAAGRRAALGSASEVAGTGARCNITASICCQTREWFEAICGGKLTATYPACSQCSTCRKPKLQLAS